MHPVVTRTAAPFPEGALRLEYHSPPADVADRAIAWLSGDPTMWSVVLHGHGTHAGQQLASP